MEVSDNTQKVTAVIGLGCLCIAQAGSDSLEVTASSVYFRAATRRNRVAIVENVWGTCGGSEHKQRALAKPWGKVSRTRWSLAKMRILAGTCRVSGLLHREETGGAQAKV